MRLGLRRCYPGEKYREVNRVLRYGKNFRLPNQNPINPCGGIASHGSGKSGAIVSGEEAEGGMTFALVSFDSDSGQGSACPVALTTLKFCIEGQIMGC